MTAPKKIISAATRCSSKILQRQERIDLLVERTEGLNRAVNNFHRSSRVLRRHMWCQKFQGKMCLAFTLSAIMFCIYCYIFGVPGSGPAPLTTTTTTSTSTTTTSTAPHTTTHPPNSTSSLPPAQAASSAFLSKEIAEVAHDTKSLVGEIVDETKTVYGEVVNRTDSLIEEVWHEVDDDNYIYE